MWNTLEAAYQGQAASAIEPLEALHKKSGDAAVNDALADAYFIAALEALEAQPPALERAQEFLLLGKHLTAHLKFEYALALADLLAGRGALRVGTCGIIRLGRHIGADLVLEIAGHLVVVPGFSLWPAAGEELTALPFDPVAQGSTARLLATAFGAATVVWAERGDDGMIRIVRATGLGNRRVGHVGRPHLDRAMFGFATLDGESGWGTIAVQIDDERWAVSSEALAPMVIACADPVLGVCSLDGAPALLTRARPDRLVWQWRDRREALPPSASPIAAAAVCTQRPQLAWVTEAGMVNVYSMEHRAILARLYSEGAE
jgi:hypothetical protein